MRRLIVAGFLLLVAGFALYGQSTAQKPFKVQYVDGTVEMQLKGQAAWKPLKVNTLVPIDATVRLVGGAAVELMLDKTRFSLIKAGTFPMAGLVSRMKTSTGTGLGASVAQKIAMITTTPNAAIAGTRSSAIAGVRGDPEKYGIPRDVMWPDSLDAIETLLNEMKFGLAEERLVRELRNPGPLKLLFEFRLAEAYLGLRQTARAWQLISSMTPGPSLGCYNDFLVLKSQLQADALEYLDSLATITPLLEPLAQNGYGQFACLIAYHDFKNLGRAEEASDIRARGIAIDPASEVAKMLSAQS